MCDTASCLLIPFCWASVCITSAGQHLCCCAPVLGYTSAELSSRIHVRGVCSLDTKTLRPVLPFSHCNKVLVRFFCTARAAALAR